MRTVSMRLTEEEIAWLDREASRMNAARRAAGRTHLGRPKYAYGRADVVRELRREHDGDRHD
ncbi:MAG: hypothetical protein M3R46_11125 [Actinomycetota bacterium]|nr:hypothetical protein [Actinomycetota bacterium]